jgi:NAD(P)H-dependent FMN reductase
MSEPVRILLVSGSTRAASTNVAALRALAGLAPAGVRTVLYGGLAELPAFNPDDDHEPLPAQVVELRAEIAAADGVLFCTPEYAGTLPGSFKNLLDWTVGGGEMYGKPVAWVNVAPEGRGEGALSSLSLVLGYVGADVLEPACVRTYVGREHVDGDGEICDQDARSRLQAALSRFLAALAERS